MTYKLVKNQNDELIAFGPNNDMYEPGIEKGQTLVIEDAEVAEPLIQSFVKKLEQEAADARTSALAKLAAIGLTEEEISAL